MLRVGFLTWLRSPHQSSSHHHSVLCAEAASEFIVLYELHVPSPTSLVLAACKVVAPAALPSRLGMELLNKKGIKNGL